MLKRFSLSTLFFLTAIAAIAVYMTDRHLNPSVSDLFHDLIARIPKEGQDEFLKPATQAQLKLADDAISQRLPDAKLPRSVKTLYSIFGGQPWDSTYETDLFPSFALNPIENAISDYRETCGLLDEYAKPHETEEFPNTWYDYRLFPFGYAPGTGTLHCVNVKTEHIYSFNADGGIHFRKFESIEDLLRQSIEHQIHEHGR